MHLPLQKVEVCQEDLIGGTSGGEGEPVISRKGGIFIADPATSPAPCLPVAHRLESNPPVRHSSHLSV